MSIKDNMAVPVLNYNSNYVFAVSNIQTYTFTPAQDGIPSVCYISFPEIVYINSASDCFRTGLLMFREDVQEEVYKEIQFADWKSIITNKEIRDILTKPTKEGLEKLIQITNESVFSRVKSVLVELKNSNADDISNRVIKVIDSRWTELKRGIFKSKIQISFKDVPVNNSIDSSELESVKAQNNALQEQILAMQKMIEQLQNKNSSADTDSQEDSKNEPKKVGRPPKNK